MGTSKFSQLGTVAVAVLLAALVIAIIKYLFLPSISMDSNSPTQNVWSLEVVAFLGILGVIFFQELFDGFQRFYILISRSRKEPKEYHHHLSPVYILVVLVVSAILYSVIWAHLEPINQSRGSESSSKPTRNLSVTDEG